VAGSCGAAQYTISGATQNTTCLPCIQAAAPNGCCEASQACSTQADCLNLLACMVQCLPNNDAVCTGTCENNYPTSVAAYDALARCVSGAAGGPATCPGCPILAQ
jgi:hypothetical protein